MILDRGKFLDETCGSVDAAMDIIDKLLSVIDSAPECKEFCQREVEKVMGTDIDYIIS
jgi:hypothetical protein